MSVKNIVLLSKEYDLIICRFQNLFSQLIESAQKVLSNITLGYDRYRHGISLKRHVIGINQTRKHMTLIRHNIKQYVFYCLWN